MIVFATEIECFSINLVISKAGMDSPRLYTENTSLVFGSIDTIMSPTQCISSSWQGSISMHGRILFKFSLEFLSKSSSGCSMEKYKIIGV